MPVDRVGEQPLATGRPGPSLQPGHTGRDRTYPGQLTGGVIHSDQAGQGHGRPARPDPHRMNRCSAPVSRPTAASKRSWSRCRPGPRPASGGPTRPRRRDRPRSCLHWARLDRTRRGRGRCRRWCHTRRSARRVGSSLLGTGRVGLQDRPCRCARPTAALSTLNRSPAGTASARRAAPRPLPSAAHDCRPAPRSPGQAASRAPAGSLPLRGLPRRRECRAGTPRS